MSEWQPIETAPTDGTEILVWVHANGTRVVVRWNSAHMVWLLSGQQRRGIFLVPEDKWHPAPPPPVQEDGK